MPDPAIKRPLRTAKRHWGGITPSSVAAPNHQREANPGDDILSNHKTTHAVNCNEMLSCPVVTEDAVRYANIFIRVGTDDFAIQLFQETSTDRTKTYPNRPGR